MNTPRAVFGVGILDALVVLAWWCPVLIYFAADATNALSLVVTLALPLSVVVGWRGTLHAQKVLSGTATARAAIREGAVCGASFVVACYAIDVLSSYASAAGGFWQGFDPSRMSNWLSVLSLVAPAAMFAACIGALHGYLLHRINCLALVALNEA